MNPKTGIIHEIEQVQDLEQLYEIRLGKRLVPIPDDQYAEVRAMNRKDRRKWARKELRREYVVK